ncbi:hypothetical protein TSOC_012606, partial [Tetrabaena socialis]
MLLALPQPLHERILAQAGRGGQGAASACRALCDAWRLALRQPTGAARYLVARYGGRAALHAYSCPGLL